MHKNMISFHFLGRRFRPGLSDSVTMVTIIDPVTAVAPEFPIVPGLKKVEEVPRLSRKKNKEITREK